MLPSILRSGVLATSVAAALICVPAQAYAEQDPWEGFNRSVFSFNETIDRYALKPAAQGYRYVTPDIAEQGVSNFFDNIADVGNVFNNLFQLKFDAAGKSFSRVAFNSTFGLVGLIDVATPMGIGPHNEDFGQTLGYWGVGSGPYIVLPFFGPSTVRDGLSKPADWAMDPISEVGHVATRNSLYGLRLLDVRARLLQAEQIISGDKYSFTRDAYLQRREYLINDGVVDVQYDSDF
ncbi:MlaA family lipoprotein [Marinobacterium weihaiense]|uniref:VacJ family lipoprotein n=1 Tax=Marinobacterium weihaiense TaxID=2851016 RepID=A0ABS6M7H0_9GAMM|nr:VacJ family lipoprotein [Marinobacterium weihaiense]MBV0932226.1 VacJ family lipoprotein [Marinobacterium weihaiense]